MQNLENLIDKRAGYTIAHVIKTLFLAAEAPVGRFGLMKELNLNEASVKTILKRLAKNKFTRPTPQGAALTKKGRGIIAKIRRKIPVLPLEMDARVYTDSGLYKSAYKKRCDAGILIKNAAKKIREGLEQRDVAVRAGAIGCTTLIQKNSKIIFPADMYEVKKEFGNYLKDRFKIKNNDVVIICFGPSKNAAEVAALTVALALV